MYLNSAIASKWFHKNNLACDLKYITHIACVETTLNLLFLTTSILREYLHQQFCFQFDDVTFTLWSSQLFVTGTIWFLKIKKQYNTHGP